MAFFKLSYVCPTFNLKKRIYIYITGFTGALGKAHIALGKGFVKCLIRQRALDKKVVGKVVYAECHLSSAGLTLGKIKH